MLSHPVVIIGSGAAGLLCALELAPRVPVVLLTRSDLEEANSRYAQGGVAAVWDEKDSWEDHFRDTCMAGAGICDPHAVEVLVREGPERIRDVITLGVPFDHHAGFLHLTQEGGHGCRRVLHAGGDATGRELERTLAEAVRKQPAIEVVEQVRCIDVSRCPSGGWTLWTQERSGTFQARGAQALILATGGLGYLFGESTNPAVTGGDGIALAWQAGARVADLEFVQFHPTVLLVPGHPRFLLTEALRGEGAVLRNAAGEAFMKRYDTRADLAPRDVVARAELAEMRSDGTNHVFLDARHLGETFLLEHFPVVTASVAKTGLAMARDLIPVSPAAHYTIGGIWTDVSGRTSLPGLYAAGEVASTGVHGANRLASNSLLECLVFGKRAAQAALEDMPNLPSPDREPPAQTWDLPDSEHLSASLGEALIDCLGLLREASVMQAFLDALGPAVMNSVPVTDMTAERVTRRHGLILARLMAQAALARPESRGTHFRSDFPRLDPAYAHRIAWEHWTQIHLP